ncbi:VOC family protein [Actinomycetospora sp. CA-053990]|uniref:VOC family protein n=1 Tax=Actinomycetospora sp. CA-053990 TaxID=3239891 RepID=UPI003D8C0579
MSGRVVHFEVPFDDGDRARAFYGAIFRWTLQDMPGMDYTIAMSGPVTETGEPEESGFINGGMFQRGPDTPRSPVLVVDVGDIDETLARVSEYGGTVVQGKQPVGEMGFAAYFRDTEDNVIGLWETAGG